MKIILTRQESENLSIRNEFYYSIDNNKKINRFTSDFSQLFLCFPLSYVESTLNEQDVITFWGARAESEEKNILITSKNALCALEDSVLWSNNKMRQQLLSCGFYAVGEKTACYARDLGFVNQKAISKDAQTLEGILLNNSDFIKKRCLYFCGRHYTHDFDAVRSKMGTDQFIFIEAYHAIENDVSIFVSGFKEVMAKNHFVGVSFFSKRTAGIFVKFIHDYGLESYFDRIIPLCISESVLESLPRICAARAKVAKTPDRQAMIQLFVDFISADVAQ